MSSKLRWLWRIALLVTVGILSGCSRQSGALVLEPLGQLQIVASSPEPEVSAVPTLVVVIPDPQEIPSTRQIAADFTQLINLRIECGRRPNSCPIDQLTAPESTYRSYLTALMDIRIGANLATRTGFGKFRFRIESIDIISSVSAIVHTCIFDSLVVFDSGQSDSTRDDIVFDDDVISGRTEWQVVVDDGKWKWSDATSTGTNYGEDICGFTS